MFSTSSTNWCGSAAGLVINFSTQCGSGELCRVGSEQGEAPDLPGTQSLLHRKAHTLFSLGLTPTVPMNERFWSKAKMIGYVSFPSFVEVLPFINSDIRAYALTP